MIHVYISGFVQGVGFRQYLKYKAKKLNLRGWVRNIPDGRVEGVFDGNKEELEKIAEVCKKGPFLSEVKKAEIDWNYKSPSSIVDFKILK